MLNIENLDLDYSSLARKEKKLSARTDYNSEIKIAIFGDVSTQHIIPILRVLFAENSVKANFYEAGYDTLELETFNLESEFFKYNPEFVIILQSVQKLKDHYYEYASDKLEYISTKTDRLLSVWRKILEVNPCHIIQSNFVIPYERFNGNFDSKNSNSFQNFVKKMNSEIIEKSINLSNVHINDIENIASWVGRKNFLNEKMWALCKALCSFEYLPLVSQNIVDIVLSVSGRAIKCLVLDLDNTLWGGVVAEDGIDGIALGDLDDGSIFKHFQSYIKQLSKRGIILTVCSKNDEELARKVFREHPAMVLKENDISVFIANWEDKATNIRNIREKLNIGFDSMVFLDDNPFERNLVRKFIPDVIVPELPEDPADYLKYLSELNLFENSTFSNLDSERSSFYIIQNQRDEERKSYHSIEEYLKSLETKVIVKPIMLSNLSRVAQLIQRSNQFNLTTKRYSESECTTLINSGRHENFTIVVEDKYGDFGLVCIAILEKKEKVLEIDSFLMSCRVLQRGIEQFAMNKIFEFAKSKDFEYVIGTYIPTKKNQIVKDFFLQFGFEKVELDNNIEKNYWKLSVEKYRPKVVHLEEINKF